MRKLNVSFKITSLDSKQQFDCLGEMKNDRIKFVDPEQNTNYIVFHNDIIEYYKKGTIDMKYKFDTSSLTKGYYRVKGHSFDFEIKTKMISVKDDSLFIKFELNQNEELVNKTELSIKYTYLEEE